MNDTQKRFNELFEKIPFRTKMYVDIQADISELLSNFLKEKKWSQRELAKKIKCHESQISTLLSGNQNLTLKTLCKISEIVGFEIVKINKR